MEDSLQAEIDRIAAREDRSRNYIINTLCRIFLAQGAIHPVEGSTKNPPHHAADKKHPENALDKKHPKGAPLTPPPLPPPTPPPAAVPKSTKNTAPPPPKHPRKKR